MHSPRLNGRSVRIAFSIAACACIVGLSATVGIAAEERCPESISVKQTLVKPEPGWQPGTSDLPIRLAGVTFFDGPPEEKASLVNDSESIVKGKQVAVWRFGPQSQIWLSCRYASSNIVLSRALTKGTSTCRVTYIPKQTIAGLPAIEKIECE
jgi:hypothetical protein